MQRPQRFSGEVFDESERRAQWTREFTESNQLMVVGLASNTAQFVRFQPLAAETNDLNCQTYCLIEDFYTVRHADILYGTRAESKASRFDHRRKTYAIGTEDQARAKVLLADYNEA